MSKILLISVCLFVVALAAETSTRPKNCTPGTTYKKDCNTCTCAANGKDACSQIDCSRQPPTSAPSTGVRPGDCPKAVPGTADCEKRNNQGLCTVDKDCPGAKKCCVDGCGKHSCRQADYSKYAQN